MIPEPLTLTPPQTLEQIAFAMNTLTNVYDAKRRTARMEQAWRGKLTARKTQESPCGLFEQRQEEMRLP